MQPSSTPVLPRRRHQIVSAEESAAPPTAPVRGPARCGWCGTPAKIVPWNGGTDELDPVRRLRGLLGHWSIARG